MRYDIFVSHGSSDSFLRLARAFARLRILVVGDDSSHAEDLCALLRRDFVVYHSMGDVGSLGRDLLLGFDVVILCPGNLFPHIVADAQETIVDFALEGGTLVSMPFAAWSVGHRDNHTIGEVLPVTADVFFESCSVTWRAGPIAAAGTGCLPNGPMLVSGEFVAAKPEARTVATALVECSDAIRETPLVCTMQTGKGQSVYINLSHHHGQDGLPVWRVSGNGTEPVPDTWPGALLVWAMRMVRCGGLSGDPTPLRDHQDTQILFTGRGVTSQHLYHLVQPAEVSIATGPSAFDHASYSSFSQVERLEVCRQAAASLAGHEYLGGEEAAPEADARRSGRHLEELAKLFFLLVPGLGVVASRSRRGNLEVDLLIRNESSHPFWKPLGSPVVVECKDLKTKAGSAEVRDLAGKLDQLGARTAFLLCPRGVTDRGRAGAKQTIRDEYRSGRTIIPVSQADLMDALRELTPTPTLRRCHESIFAS